jgi:hypothetical protein
MRLKRQLQNVGDETRRLISFDVGPFLPLFLAEVRRSGGRCSKHPNFPQ